MRNALVLDAPDVNNPVWMSLFDSLGILSRERAEMGSGLEISVSYISRLDPFV
jgi:hypothetical protein